MQSWFSTLTFAQGMLLPLSALFVGLETYFIPPGELRTIIMAFTAAVFAQLITSFRKPSTQGGTVTPAASITVAGKAVATPAMAEASAKAAEKAPEKTSEKK